VAGFPIFLLLLEGLRCIPHGEFLGGQTARRKHPFTLGFEHEDEHVHEHEE
jgi:hypothetical protein